MSTPQAHTKEEVRESFLDACRFIAAYWGSQTGNSNLDRCEGVVHSMLTMIDGLSSHGPAITLTLEPHADDKQFHIDEGDNWFEPGMAFNDDCYLHDMFYKQPEAVAEPSTAPVQPETAWPKLDAPAAVGGALFGTGITTQWVVKAAQRLFECGAEERTKTPEQRQEDESNRRALWDQIHGAPVQPQAEPVAWMLEIIVNGEKRHQWFFAEKANCMLTERSHGGVCTPLYAGTAPVTQADKLDAERYRELRTGRYWSVIDGIGDMLQHDVLDAAIDAFSPAIAAMKGTP